MSRPKISIITPSYQQAEYLAETLDSVARQRYPALEHIVIDGGSTDGSAELLRQRADGLAWWVSEPDAGQADAINKGLARATGEVVAFLNSDDLYLPGALAAVGDYFAAHPEVNWICGGWLIFGDMPGLQTSSWFPRVPANAAECLYQNFSAAQPAHFWRAKLFARHGGFDPQYRYCFDHELYVRLLLGGERCVPVNLPLAAYRFHGTSKTVAEGGRFAAEWTAIRERYLGQTDPVEERRARREWRLKESFVECHGALDDLRAGRRDEAWARFGRTVFRQPTSLARRFGWGCLRRLLGGG